MFEIVKYGGLLGKAAGVYAKRITPEEFAEMKQKASAEEIVAQLKAHAGYSDILSEFSERDFDREKVEHKLTMMLERDFGMLYRYTTQADKDLLKYFITKNEVEQILSYVRFIVAERTESYTYEPTSLIANMSCVDFSKFKTVKTFDEFIELLAGTPYHSILLAYKGKERLDYTHLEVALLTYHYKKFKDLIKKHAKGSAKKNLTAFLNTYLDMKNFTNILRCIYINQDRQSIYGYLMPFSSDAASKQLVGSMINASTYQEAFSLLAESRFGSYFKTTAEDGTKYIETHYLEYGYKFARETIGKLEANVGLVVAYLVYKDLEIKNIVHLIEAKSYNLSPEAIEPFLIGVKKAG